jgi:hypothetical protein
VEMTATKTEIKHIVALIDAAISEWDGWDWEVGFEDRRGNVYSVSGDTLDCYLPPEVREQAQEYYDEVMTSVDAARANGQDAIDCLLRGDLEGALAALEAAVGYEIDYGAAPAWGPPLQALEALMGEE